MTMRGKIPTRWQNPPRNPRPNRSTPTAPRRRRPRAGDVPTLTPYPAKDPDGSAMLVFPGGGYGNLAKHEGEPVAQWLGDAGHHARSSCTTGSAPRYRHPAMLQDAAHAVRTVRAMSREWKLDPEPHRRPRLLRRRAPGGDDLHAVRRRRPVVDRPDREGQQPAGRVGAVLPRHHARRRLGPRRLAQNLARRQPDAAN